MTDDGSRPWLTLAVRADAYTDQERLDLSLQGMPPICRWDDERADHPFNCRCPRHQG